MRLRNIPKAGEYLKASSWVVDEPKSLQGRWKQLAKDRPIHIEVGMGKGGFLIDMAKQNPHLYFVGLEKYESVMYKGVRKLEREFPNHELDNLIFLQGDAKYLLEYFAPGEVAKVYLSFSDPWPKSGHYKRRLTYRDFLSIYKTILEEEGQLQFRTDNQPLFDFSVQELQESFWQMTYATRDLHHEPHFEESQPQTEYERKFSSLGQPIYQLRAFPKR